MAATGPSWKCPRDGGASSDGEFTDSSSELHSRLAAKWISKESPGRRPRLLVDSKGGFSQTPEATRLTSPPDFSLLETFSCPPKLPVYSSLNRRNVLRSGDAWTPSPNWPLQQPQSKELQQELEKLPPLAANALEWQTRFSGVPHSPTEDRRRVREASLSGSSRTWRVGEQTLKGLGSCGWQTAPFGDGEEDARRLSSTAAAAGQVLSQLSSTAHVRAVTRRGFLMEATTKAEVGLNNDVPSASKKGASFSSPSREAPPRAAPEAESGRSRAEALLSKGCCSRKGEVSFGATRHSAFAAEDKTASPERRTPSAGEWSRAEILRPRPLPTAATSATDSRSFPTASEVPPAFACPCQSLLASLPSQPRTSSEVSSPDPRELWAMLLSHQKQLLRQTRRERRLLLFASGVSIVLLVCLCVSLTWGNGGGGGESALFSHRSFHGGRRTGGSDGLCAMASVRGSSFQSGEQPSLEESFYAWRQSASLREKPPHPRSWKTRTPSQVPLVALLAFVQRPFWILFAVLHAVFVQPAVWLVKQLLFALLKASFALLLVAAAFSLGLVGLASSVSSASTRQRRELRGEEREGRLQKEQLFMRRASTEADGEGVAGSVHQRFASTCAVVLAPCLRLLSGASASLAAHSKKRLCWKQQPRAQL